MTEKVEDEYLEDIDGNRIKVTRINGKLTAAIPGLKERKEKLPAMKGRQDDVSIVAYQKAEIAVAVPQKNGRPLDLAKESDEKCTHWAWEIATMLIRRKAETVTEAKETHFLEFVEQDVLNQHPSPRLLNTHVTPDLYPRELIEKRCKILYIQRNPKDILVSLYHHLINLPIFGYENGSWPAFFELCMNEAVDFLNWFDYTLEWEKLLKENPEIPVLKLYYEDMSKNLRGEVQRIADFLDIQVDDNTLDEITKLCTFQHMQKEKTKNLSPKMLSMWKNGECKIYRKGVVGDWKNWFTVAQNERFDAQIEKKFTGSNITINWQ